MSIDLGLSHEGRNSDRVCSWMESWGSYLGPNIRNYNKLW